MLDRAGLITEIENFYVRGDINDATWSIYLDLALEEAEKEFIFRELKSLQSYTLASADNNITIAPLWRAIYYVYYTDDNSNQFRIRYMPVSEFEERYASGSNSTGPPRNYTIWGNTMLFGPYSDAAYTISTREARYSGTPFADGSGTTESPVSRIDYYLIRWAAGHAHQVKGQSDLSEDDFAFAKAALAKAKGAGLMDIVEGEVAGSGPYEVSR